MAKSLMIFDLYNTLITDECIDRRHQYLLNAIWSVIDKAGYPIRFGEVIDAYEYTKEHMYSFQKEYFSLSIFEIVRIFSKQIKITDITHLKKIYDIWAYASLQIPPVLLKNVKEGLELLKLNNKKIALISNTAHTPGIALRFLLKEYEIYDLFDDLVFSDEFGFSKPNPMIFNRVLEFFKIEASEAVFTGDHSLYDKAGSENIGIEYKYIDPSLDFIKIAEELLEL